MVLFNFLFYTAMMHFAAIDGSSIATLDHEKFITVDTYHHKS